MPALATYQQALEEELRDGFEVRQGFLYDLLRYHLGWIDQRGQPQESPLPQHFQPLLALASCEAASGDFRPALPVAAAVELLYNFTLVHGDVQAGRVDSEDRPNIWWVWGPAQAINAGDGLHALGRTAILRLAQRGVPADLVLQAVTTLDQTCLRLCEGQYLDLSFQDQLMVTTGEYFDMIERKAGALTGCAAGLGALVGGAPEGEREAHRRFGIKLGMAWQITQDLADLWGRSGDGMTPSNLLNKKKSLPLIYALEQASTAAKRELGNIYIKRVLEPQDAARVLAILDEVDAGSYAQIRVQELIDQSMADLDQAAVSPKSRADLESLGQWALSA
ncbi:MAG: polyprenyl synthetase family protein [Dehalococcoidia bacterium]